MYEYSRFEDKLFYLFFSLCISPILPIYSIRHASDIYGVHKCHGAELSPFCRILSEKELFRVIKHLVYKGTRVPRYRGKSGAESRRGEVYSRAPAGTLSRVLRAQRQTRGVRRPPRPRSLRSPERGARLDDGERLAGTRAPHAGVGFFSTLFIRCGQKEFNVVLMISTPPSLRCPRRAYFHYLVALACLCGRLLYI